MEVLFKIRLKKMFYRRSNTNGPTTSRIPSCQTTLSYPVAAVRTKIPFANGASLREVIWDRCYETLLRMLFTNVCNKLEFWSLAGFPH